VDVALTAPEQTSATVFRLRHRNASARDVFVATVNAALPARDADARRRDGAELVVVLPGEPPRAPFWAAGEFWLMAGAGLVVAGWIAGLVTLIVHVDIFGAILYFFGTKPLIFGVFLYGLSARTLYDRAVLRRRGVPVLATHFRHDGKKHLYQFTDLDGVRRTGEPDTAAEPVSTNPTRVQVSYDPRNPQRVAARLPVRTWVLRSLGVGIGGTAMLFAGLYMVPYQLIQVLFQKIVQVPL
jgi:hypothetical protein